MTSGCDLSVTHLDTHWPPCLTSSLPRVAPFAPGNFANRLSKLRFSWTMSTTCWIGELPVPRCLASRMDCGSDSEAPPHPASKAEVTQLVSAMRLKSQRRIYRLLAL